MADEQDDSQKTEEPTQKKLEDARQKGVTAVPTFLVAQQYVVSGAQPTDTWEKVIAELTGKTE